MGSFIEQIIVHVLNFPGYTIPKTMFMSEFESGQNAPLGKEVEGRKNVKAPILQNNQCDYLSTKKE